GAGIVALLEHVVLVGDVQRSEHGHTQRIHGVGALGDCAHLGVDEIGELVNVVGVGAAKVVALVEDLNPNAVGRLDFWQSASCYSSVSARSSLCFSIFSTRARTSSRSLRKVTS